MSKPRALSFILCIVVLLAAGPAADAKPARTGVITGKLKSRGLGQDARLDARAVSVRTGLIADAISVPVGADYDLTVPPGAYMVVAGGVDLRRGKQMKAHSHIIQVGRPRIAHRDLRLRAAGSSKVAGVEAITVSGLPEWPHGFPLHDFVSTDLAAGCGRGPNKFRLVELLRRKDQIKELELLGRQPHFIRHGYVVRGSGRVSGGTVSMELRLVDRHSGSTVTRGSVSGPEARFLDLIDDLDHLFLDAVCKGRRRALPQPPPRYRMIGYRAEYHGTGSDVSTWDCPPSTTVAQDKGERRYVYSWSFAPNGEVVDGVPGTVTVDPYEHFVFQRPMEPANDTTYDDPPSTRAEVSHLENYANYPNSPVGLERDVLHWESVGPVSIAHDLRVPGKVGDRFVLDLSGSRTEEINCGSRVREEHGTVTLAPVVFDRRYDPPPELIVPYQ
jgi:hypothetical protein